MQWVRKCSQCRADILYSDKYKLATATRNNTKCSKCWRFGKKLPTKSDYSKCCPSCGKIVYFATKYSLRNSILNSAVCNSCIDRGNNGRIQTEDEKEKRAAKLQGLTRSRESKKRYSKAKRGKNNPRYGTHISKSEEHRRKIRLSCIEVIKNRLALAGKQMTPVFNPVACSAIDEYGTQYGYHFQHALNGGEYYIKELGYWVDGYDKDKNVVVEFYENNHWHRKNKKKDVDRMNEIVHHLHCDFVILREEIGGGYLPEHICK